MKIGVKQGHFTTKKSVPFKGEEYIAEDIPNICQKDCAPYGDIECKKKI